MGLNLGSIMNSLGLGSTNEASGTSQAILTPEQTQQNQLLLSYLQNVFLPNIQGTQTGAQQTLSTINPYAYTAAKGSYDLGNAVSSYAGQNAGQNYNAGMSTLQALFDPNYEKGQVQAALQTGREAARESQAGQNAMYGAAGGLGSARQALADRNLYSLNAQRQATAAAGAQAQVQANRANAANAVLGSSVQLGTLGLQGGQQAINASQSPMDLMSKYASIIYGLPQNMTTANYSGTQGSSNQSNSSGFKLF